MKSKVNNAALGALTNQNNSNRNDDFYTPPSALQNPLEIISNKMKNSTESNPDFTGIARSVVCVKNQGFNNFQICTLYIEKGKVVRMDKSDKWQSFECFAFLEMVSKISCDNLNNNFEDGKAFSK